MLCQKYTALNTNFKCCESDYEPLIMEPSSSSEIEDNSSNERLVSDFKNINFDCQISDNFGYVYSLNKIKQVQNRWQALTATKYVCIKTTKGFGQNAFDDLLKHNLQWELPSLGSAGQCNKGLDYDGIPFIIVATKVMDCQYGVDRHLKRKLTSSSMRNQKTSEGDRKRLRSSNKECKKLDCPAQVLVKDVLKFPDFKISQKTDAKKVQASRKLRRCLESNKMVVGERRFYIKVPLPTEHKGHPFEEGESMKAVQQSAPGGPDSLVVDPIHLRPKPKDKEILIEVAYSAVNRVDILQRKGATPAPESASPILGLEVAGTVYKLGPKCSGKWKEGDRVMALLTGGGYAEYATVNEDHVMAIPADMSFKEAAAIPEVWLTAYQLLHLISRVSKEDFVLIHAGGSGVGTAAVQLVALAGAKPVVTAGSQEKIDVAISLGAIAGINYKKEDFETKIHEITKGKGANIILDCVGSSYWAKNLEALAMDGHWVLYGLLGGPNVKGNFLGGLLKKRATLSATTLRTRSDEYKANLIEEFHTKVLPLFSQKGKTKLKAIIDRVFPLDEIQEAHRYVELNKNIGKVLLQVKPSEDELTTEEGIEESAITGHEEL